MYLVNKPGLQQKRSQNSKKKVCESCVLKKIREYKKRQTDKQTDKKTK